MPKRIEQGETRAAEVLTVAWTVSVTAVLLCNLAAVGGHAIARAVDPAGPLRPLANLILFGGCVIGAVSLMLLPVVLRVRRLPPPLGLVVFAVLVGAAPIVGAVLLALESGDP